MPPRAAIIRDLKAGQVQRRLTMAAVAAAAIAAAAAAIGTVPDADGAVPQHTGALTGRQWVDELLDGHAARIHNNLGMHKHVFRRLVSWLKAHCGLTDTRWVTKEEQLAIFLYATVTNLSNRKLAERFQRSGDTISRIFHRVLDCILKEGFYNAFVTLPSQNVPIEIRENALFWPYFKDCIGAIDGSHILVNPPSEDEARFRDRKGHRSINALAATDFKMFFVYVLSGWEGSAADGTIYEDAHATDFTVPEGKYYVADAGFPSCDALLVPYRGVRYHLREWSASNLRPVSPEELFNLRHAMLRNVVERIFGVVKKRFGSLREATWWPIATQAALVPALCAIHNFILVHDPHDVEELEDPPAPRTDNGEPGALGGAASAAEKRRADQRRDEIAAAMWADFQNRRR